MSNHLNYFFPIPNPKLPMPVERYYSDRKLEKNEKIELKEGEFHHLAHVIRSRKGDLVELVNGKGVLAHAVLDELKKDRAFLIVKEIFQLTTKPSRLILAQALPKPNRLDYILEKGTELGVDEFWLFPGELSSKKEIYPNQLERAQALTIAAMKQCGRLSLPSITIHPFLEKWKSANCLLFFGDVNPDAPSFEKVWSSIQPLNLQVVFVTGPESGFTAGEIESLKRMGAHGVKLHDNILRTDTASIMALSLISHWMLRQT